MANVADEAASGEGGLELRRGVKRFPAGARVWVLPPQWGDGGDQLIVVGHHRGTHGRQLARMVVSRRHLAGFRVQGIYSPAVMRALTRPLAEFGRDHAPRLWSNREEAERTVANWRDRPLTARADDWSFIPARVTDPPSVEIAHNAHRAIYSPQPPPVEPPRSG